MKHHAHVVLDEDDRELAVAMQPANELGDFVGFLVAHSGRRLVQQQQPGAQRQRHGDLGGALIAVGELAHEPVGLVGEPGEAQRLFDPALQFRALRAADPGAQPKPRRHLGADAHVLPHAQLRKDLGDLEGARHAELDPRVRRHSGDVAPVEYHAACGRREQATDEIEERGLAGAVRADHRPQFSLRHRKRDVADGREPAEMLGSGDDFQQHHAWTLRRMAPSSPRGKNSTTNTNSSPMNDIQLTVMLER